MLLVYYMHAIDVLIVCCAHVTLLLSVCQVQCPMLSLWWAQRNTCHTCVTVCYSCVVLWYMQFNVVLWYAAVWYRNFILITNQPVGEALTGLKPGPVGMLITWPMSSASGAHKAYKYPQPAHNHWPANRVSCAVPFIQSHVSMHAPGKIITTCQMTMASYSTYAQLTTAFDNHDHHDKPYYIHHPTAPTCMRPCLYQASKSLRTAMWP
jgi:hypothetical protein